MEFREAFRVTQFGRRTAGPVEHHPPLNAGFAEFVCSSLPVFRFAHHRSHARKIRKREPVPKTQILVSPLCAPWGCARMRAPGWGAGREVALAATNTTKTKFETQCEIRRHRLRDPSGPQRGTRDMGISHSGSHSTQAWDRTLLGAVPWHCVVVPRRGVMPSLVAGQRCRPSDGTSSAESAFSARD